MAIIRNQDGLIMTVPDDVSNDYVEQGWQDLSHPAVPETAEVDAKPRRSRKKTED